MKNICYLLLCLLLPSLGCKKLLEEKSDKKLVVPNSLKDYQAMLDNASYMMNTPASGEISADDYYLSDSDWASLSQINHKRMYIWEADNLFDPSEPENDWQYLYTVIYYANTVLEGLSKNNEVLEQKRFLEGQAHIHRAIAYFNVVSLWANYYSNLTGANELGVPIRNGLNFNEKSTRASLAEVYGLIQSDLKKAAQQLPNVVSSKFRPNRAAAYGMMARVALHIGNYDDAYLYADSCLRIQDKLIDYSTLQANANYPIVVNNDEVIFYKIMRSKEPIQVSRAKISPSLYQTYEINDCRKEVFFRINADQSFRFKGSYFGGSNHFTGIATDEVFLIKSESAVRLGKVEEGLGLLDHLMKHRYKKVNGITTYIPLVTQNKELALTRILNERRKELVMRGLRWLDLRRLNHEGAQLSLYRTINGKTHILPSGSLKFVLPIPEQVIQFSGMKQNPR